MDFGRLPNDEINSVDFSLPAEPARNNHVLPGTPATQPTVYIGMPKWGRTEWVGKLYPTGTKAKEFLPQYVQHFNSVELNATHYKLYSPYTIEKWAAEASGRNFKFCPKLFQGITHRGAIHKKSSILEEALQGLAAFGDNLGPVFIQLQDTFSDRRKGELFEFLESLPANFEFFIEMRHPHYLSNNKFFEYLQTKKIGAVITDTAGRRDCAHLQLTVPKTMIRFVCNDGHPSDYTRIDEWAVRIKSWLDRGMKEIYFFVHISDETKSLEMANYVIEKVNEKCKLYIPPLVLQ